MIKAIETVYQGYRFRSRLEARWAVFFDMLGIQWVYEPEGFDVDGRWYLPDFYLQDFGCFAEIKPVPFTFKQFALCYALNKPVVLCDGVPDFLMYFCTGIYKTSLSPYTVREVYQIYTDGDDWGVIDWDLSRFKGRLWYSFGEGGHAADFFYEEAVNKARQARFEYGELGKLQNDVAAQQSAMKFINSLSC